MFYVSTSWNFTQHADAKSVLEEIKQLGIGGVELNFNLSHSMAEEFALLKKKGMVEIASIHNYCPIPGGVAPKKASPDNPSLSSMDGEERKLAVEDTKHTIDFASSVGAKAVVLHIGKIDIKDRTVELSRVKKENHLYAEMKVKMREERKQNARPYLENAVRSLEELEPYAAKMGVCLGIENRYYFREIPSLDEMDYILDYFGKSSIYYWHDAGHAQTQENLALANHEDYLKRLSRRLLGLHLHDVTAIEDHKVPGDGDFDFKRLIPYIKKDTLKIIETHQPATVDDMRRGLGFLKEIFEMS